jgi:hypothetical protein
VAVFVTDDSYLRPGGNIDPDDQRVLDQAGADGDLVVMSSQEALEQMSKELAAEEKPAPKGEKPPIGVPLDAKTMAELGHAATKRMAVFSAQIELSMTQPRAAFVRRLRCGERAAWRKVARQYYLLYGGDWEPQSNQIAGMALCQAAASFFGESPREAPWN